MPQDVPVHPGAFSRFALSLWRLAVSPVSFVVISVLWCIDLGVGSLLADRRPDLFGSLDFYPFAVWLAEEGERAWPLSLWVHFLVVLSWIMVASLLLCTVNWFLYRRRRLKGLGEILVHLGFLFVFAGYVVGAAYGARTTGVKLPVGGTAQVPAMEATLALFDMRPLLSPTGEVQGARSDLELRSPRGSLRSPAVQINHPLIAGSTVVYPRGVVQRVEGVRVSLGSGEAVDLHPGLPVPVPGLGKVEAVLLLQPDETRDNLEGPGALVTVRSGDGGIIGTAYLSSREGMPAEAAIAGKRISLVTLLGPFLGQFDVHRDPGVRLVIIGAALITLGSLWAFGGYLREGSPS